VSREDHEWCKTLRVAESGRGHQNPAGSLNTARRICQVMFLCGLTLFVVCLLIAEFGGSGRPPGQSATAIAKVVANGGKPSCKDTAKYLVRGEPYYISIRTFTSYGGSQAGGPLCNPKPIGTAVAVDYSPFNPGNATIQAPDHRGQWFLLALFGVLLAGLAAVFSP